MSCARTVLMHGDGRCFAKREIGGEGPGGRLQLIEEGQYNDCIFRMYDAASAYCNRDELLS